MNSPAVNATSIIALCAIATFLCATATLLYTSSPGSVEPINASAYAIFRGMGPFDSDLIVVPIEWKNFGGQPALVMQPRLIVTFENKSIVNYYLAGEFTPNSNSEAGYVGNTFTLKQDFIVDPHSITPTILVFHVQNWSGENKSFTFRGEAGKKVNVDISYYYISYWDMFGGKEAYPKTQFLMPITFRDWIKDINKSTDWKWDMDTTELVENEESWISWRAIFAVLIVAGLILIIPILYINCKREVNELKQERNVLKQRMRRKRAKLNEQFWR